MDHETSRPRGASLRAIVGAEARTPQGGFRRRGPRLSPAKIAGDQSTRGNAFACSSFSGTGESASQIGLGLWRVIAEGAPELTGLHSVGMLVNEIT